MSLIFLPYLKSQETKRRKANGNFCSLSFPGKDLEQKPEILTLVTLNTLIQQLDIFAYKTMLLTSKIKEKVLLIKP